MSLVALASGACDVLGLGDCRAEKRPRDQSARTSIEQGVWGHGNGFHEMALPSGTYTFFVRIDSLLYANEWHGAMPGAILQPATVTSGEVVKRQLDLTYDMVS